MTVLYVYGVRRVYSAFYSQTGVHHSGQQQQCAWYIIKVRRVSEAAEMLQIHMPGVVDPMCWGGRW